MAAPVRPLEAEAAQSEAADTPNALPSDLSSNVPPDHFNAMPSDGDGGDQPILRLSRDITVRKWRYSDAASMAHHANNPKISRNMSERFKLPFTEAYAAEWISKMLDPAEWAPVGKGKPTVSEDGDVKLQWDGPLVATRYAIAIDDVAVGAIALGFGKGEGQRCANFAYWLSEDYWGRGIITEVATAFLAWAWETFDDVLMTLEGHALGWNPASSRVLQKIGFKHIGRMPQIKWKLEALLDADMFCMTRSQFVEARAS